MTTSKQDQEQQQQQDTKTEQALVDTEGNVWGTESGLSIPERPTDLLENMDRQKQQGQEQDRYYGARVWICDEGSDRCWRIRFNDTHQGTRYRSNPYLISELEDGVADGFEASWQRDLFDRLLNHCGGRDAIVRNAARHQAVVRKNLEEAEKSNGNS